MLNIAKLTEIAWVYIKAKLYGLKLSIDKGALTCNHS